MTMSPGKKVAFAAIMTALALILSYIEVLIPFITAVPGIKLGISNLVVLILLYKLGFGYALIVDVARVLLAGLLFTGPVAMLFSLAGALISVAVMGLLMRTNAFSVTGVSMSGGVAHNLGQLLIAAPVVSSMKVFVYFPVLMVSGLVCGAIIGILAYLIIRRINFMPFSS